MAKITLSQAIEYATNAGFKGASLNTIVAIADAESGFDTTIVNWRDPHGGSFGVLQINGVHNQPTSVTFDPQKSFDYAFQLSNGGTNFSAWSTYTNGDYKKTPAWQQLTTSNTVVSTVTPVETTVQQTNTPLGFGPLDAIGNFLSGIGGAISWIGNPTRVFKMLAGIGLVFVAIFLLVANNSDKIAGVTSKMGLEFV